MSLEAANEPVLNPATGATGGAMTMIPMRDGVCLMTDLYMPDGKGPWPAILIRHPYGQPYGQDIYRNIADDGFVLAHQQSRGRFGSEGSYSDPYHVDADDGEDTVEWLARQPWCTGKVGVMGGSYVGSTTWLATMRQPAGLGASAPLNAALPWDAFPYVADGVCCLDALVMWSFALVGQYTAGRKPDVVKRLSPAFQEIVRLTEESVRLTYEATACRNDAQREALIGRNAAVIDEQNRLMQDVASGSLTDFLKDMEQLEPWVRDWAEHQVRDDPYWASVDPFSACQDIQTPVLVVAGWYDTFTRTAIDNFEALRKNPGSGTAHRLVVGPWSHASLSQLTDTGVVSGELVFPLETYADPWSLFNLTSHLDTPALFQRWFFQHLCGNDCDPMPEAPIRIYVMGENRWRNEYEWPIARTRWTTRYLHSGGRANTLNGDGKLSNEIPGDQRPDQYDYDPANPAPSIGGRWLQPPKGGPRDRRAVQSRQDVLVYSSEALKEPLEVTGIPRVKLWVSTTAVDTDFTATLVDVHPDGKAYILCDGVVRLRFRQERPGPVIPGEIQEAEIELFPTSILFGAEHRIRLEISSSNGHYFDPNPNTGKSLLADASQEKIVARQTVYHGPQTPSQLMLPVIPRS